LVKDFFENGKFRWGVNIDNMWVYAGVPPPKNIDPKQIVEKKIKGSFGGFFRRRPRRASKPFQSIEEAPELRQQASESISKLISELKRARVDFVRCWFQWNFFEPVINSSPLRFPLDEFVSRLKSQGIEIVAVLGNGYSRFLPVGIDENDPKGYLDALDRASTEIVSHYSNSIGIWQIENEPNWWFAHAASGWRHGTIWETVGFHDAVLQTFQRIIREKSPSSAIVINLEADRKRTDWKNYSKLCDAIGLDFYPNYLKPIPIDASSFDLSSEVKAQTGIPIFIAETGYPSGPTYEGFSESNQETYVSVAARKAYSLDALSGIALWRYSDSNWRSFPKQENYFGLRRDEGTPKPSWTRYMSEIGHFKSRKDSIELLSK
jgi:hypothetical protein